MDSNAFTKIQSVVLIAVIVVAAVGGGAGYMLWRASLPPSENIRIGVLGSLDMPLGKALWQGAILAAEQINAQGGILGRNLSIVTEDIGGGDLVVFTTALTKLVTTDGADYVIMPSGGSVGQDICAAHKKIQFSVGSSNVEYTQRVLDDYDKYKYFFRILYPNTTVVAAGMTDEVLTMRNNTGFNKLAYLVQNSDALLKIASGLNASAVENGFEVVYGNVVEIETTDFTSYLAAIEASGAEILFPIFGTQADISLVKEWYDRQSPFVLWGSLPTVGGVGVWNLTEGRCEYVSFPGGPVDAGYPITNKTLPFREAFFNRWGEQGSTMAAAAYDVVRLILPGAIERAGTTETDAVIKALEKTNMETTLARHFVFTSSHDVMVELDESNRISVDYMCIFIFQWQNGTQVPVYPKEIMNEAGATYKFPEWAGPWDRMQAP